MDRVVVLWLEVFWASGERFSFGRARYVVGFGLFSIRRSSVIILNFGSVFLESLG